MNTTDTDFLNEDYVSFETADLMRNKGFPQKRENSGYYATEMVYGITEQDDGTHHLCHQYPACYHFDDHICAPTLQMAMKWLRKEHNIYISIDCCYDKNVYYTFDIFRLLNNQYEYIGGTGQDFEDDDWNDGWPVDYTYEQACESAIKYVLLNLI